MSVNLRQKKHVEVFTSAVATATSSALSTTDYRNVIVTIAYDADFAGTIKFNGSAEPTDPDYTTAKGLTNLYSGIQVREREDDAIFDGNDGIVVVAAAANVRIVEFNTNLLESISIDLTLTAGTVTVTAQFTTNA